MYKCKTNRILIRNKRLGYLWNIISSNEIFMSESSLAPPLTELLNRWQRGEKEAIDEVMPLIYKHLTLIAKNYMGAERLGHTFSAMDLVQEAFCKLLPKPGGDKIWNDRTHFFAMAAKMMRWVLITHANQYKAQKRGGGPVNLISLDLDLLGAHPEQRLRQLDEAIDLLESKNKQSAWVVELYYFCGFTIEEIAIVLSVSNSTVKRKLKFSRAFLGKLL